MMNTRPLIVLALLLCLSRPVAIAQDDDSRRWAIDFRLSPVKPVVSLNETPDKYYDPLKAGGGPNFSAHLEYFIPQTGFSVVGGYDHEVMDFYSGDVSADLSQIMLGGRWYFLSKSCPLQPYLGVSTFWNVAGRKDAGTVSTSGMYGSYERKYSVSSPVLSVAPWWVSTYICFRVWLLRSIMASAWLSTDTHRRRRHTERTQHPMQCARRCTATRCQWD